MNHGIPFGLNIKSNVFKHTSVRIQCTTYIFMSVCGFRFHLYGSIVFLSMVQSICTLCAFIVVRKLNEWDGSMGWRWFIRYPYFLTLKFQLLTLAYLYPKSHFMHHRFESKCVAFYRCPAFIHSTRLYLYFSISCCTAQQILYRVELKNDRMMENICKHCENIVIAFVALMNRKLYKIVHFQRT